MAKISLRHPPSREELYYSLLRLTGIRKDSILEIYDKDYLVYFDTVKDAQIEVSVPIRKKIIIKITHIDYEKYEEELEAKGPVEEKKILQRPCIGRRWPLVR